MMIYSAAGGPRGWRVERPEALLSVLSLSDDVPFYPAADDDPPRRRLRFAGRGLAVVLLLAATYWPALGGGFLWTDEPDVTRNVLLRTAGGLGRAWRHPGALPSFPAAGPLAYALLWPQYRLWGTHYPTGYHVVSLLLHAGSALTAWAVLRRLAVPGAWLAAAGWALHPVQVQSVAWVGRQGDLLAGLLYLLALLLFLRHREVAPPVPDEDGGGGTWQEPAGPWRRRAEYAGALLLLGLALLAAPPSAVAWPLAAAVLLWWRPGGRAGRADLAALAPFAALSVAAIAVTAVVVGRHWADSGGQDARTPPLAAALAAGRVCWVCAGNLAWPDLPLARARSDASSPVDWQNLLALAAVAAVLAGLWSARRRLGRGPVAAAAFYVLNLVPPFVAGGGPADARSVLVADRLQYVAGLGPVALIVGAAVWAVARGAGTRVGNREGTRNQEPGTSWNRRDGRERPPTVSCFLFPVSAFRGRLARLAFGVALTAALCVLTVRQASAYADERRLWQAVLDDDPGLPVAHRRLAALDAAAGRPGRAADRLLAWVGRRPDDAESLLALADLYKSTGRWDDAAWAYERVIRLRPDDAAGAAAEGRLGGVYAAAGQGELAARHYARALARRPADAGLHNDLGLVLSGLGRPDEATAEFELALRHDPNCVPAKLNLASAYFRGGRLAAAAELLQEVVRADPSNYAAYFNAGSMLGELKDYPRAERMLRNAVRLRPDAAEAWDQLGVALAAQGRLGEAAYAFGKAADLAPADPRFRGHLAAAAERRGRRNGGPATGPAIEGIEGEPP